VQIFWKARISFDFLQLICGIGLALPIEPPKAPNLDDEANFAKVSQFRPTMEEFYDVVSVAGPVESQGYYIARDL
jgi:hypothetical protein